MLTTTVFVLCSVALTPGGCPTGNCSGTHLGHLDHGHPGLIHGAHSVLGEDVLLVEDGAILGVDATRPSAPVIRLRGFRVGVRDIEGELTSADKPALWPAVPMGPYTVLVELQMRLQAVDKLGYVQLLQDGKVLNNHQYYVARDERFVAVQDPQHVTLTYTYRLPCPAPGKHLLQARYLLDGQWSRLSLPLRFEASLPAPPKIVAISDLDREPIPLPKAGTISITKSAVKVRLADVTESDSVVAYLDGKPISLRPTTGACCRLIQLQGFIEPGVHTLTVRTVWNPTGCSVTSESSNEVVFHYYDENVYLLRPNRRCNSCPTSADDRTQASRAGTPSSPEATRDTQSSIIAAQTNTPFIQLAGFVRDERASRFRTANLLRETAQAPAHARLVSFLAENHADEAVRFRGEAIIFADATAQSVKDAEASAASARQRAEAAETAANAAAAANTDAEAAKIRAQAALAVAHKAVPIAALSSEPDAKDARDAVGAARAAAATDWQTVCTAAHQVISNAHESARQAQEAKRIYADALAVKQEVETASRRAFEAAEQSKTLADEAAAFVNRDAQKLQEKRNLAEIQRNRAEEWMKVAKERANAAAGLTNQAEGCRRQAEAAKTAAQALMQNTRDAAGKVEQSGASARLSAMTVVRLTIDAATTAVADAIKRTDVANRTAVPRESAAEAEADAEAAATAADQAKASCEAAMRSASEATALAAKADSYVVEEAKRGDTARLRVARIHARQAAKNRDAAHRHAQVATDAYHQAHHEAGEAQQASVDALAIAETAKQHENQARPYVDAADAARADVVAMLQMAQDAAAACRRAATDNDLDLASKAIVQALKARETANQRSHDAKVQQALAKPSTDEAAPTASRVRNEAVKARMARQRAEARTKDVETAAESAKGDASAAAQNTADAGRLLDLSKLIETRRDLSKVDEEYRAVRPLLSDIDVQLAPNRAAATGQLAQEEEAEAEVRVAIAQARDRIERARAVQGPPSPFYFASTAHFPMRKFGGQGETLERDGAVIYEDMKFSFDRDGNYNVRFTIGTPAVPTTIQLRFLVQAGQGAPWYTITLEPISFSPNKLADGRYEAAVFRNHVVQGNSEILRRCYGEMGQDATIRREGTARFGFGLSQDAGK